MKVRIYTDHSNTTLYDGEADMVFDRVGCICFVSPWPKKFEKLPDTPSLQIKVKDGTTIKVAPPDPDRNEDPCIVLQAPLADNVIIQNMKDVWANQAAQSEVS